MKLRHITESLVTEVFDRLNMDGVSIVDDDDYQTVYQFHSDDGTEYSVQFVREKASFSDFEIFHEIAKPYWDDQPLITHELILSAGSEGSLKPTGKGNFGFVYGKMLSIINDYMEKKEPEIMVFSGENAKMDAVYSRMIKKFKNAGDKALYPIGMEFYATGYLLNWLLDPEAEEALKSKLPSYDQKSTSIIRSKKDKINQERRKKLGL